MSEPIYFSKIEFTERIGYWHPNSVILLNLIEKELSYQVFDWKRQMPSISGTVIEEWFGEPKSRDVNYPARVISSSKSEFKPQVLKSDWHEPIITFSYGMKLSDETMKKILPLCNALDYEPFRNKKMSMEDEGYFGYRDEITVSFCGITDSYIPMIELPMSYYYDEEHIWPNEKLYRYIIRDIFGKKSKLKGHYTPYGGASLFI